MDIAEVRNIRDNFEPNGRRAKVTGGDVIRFSLFVLLGMLLVVYPIFFLGAVAVAAALGFGSLALMHLRRAGLELWHVLVLIALTGYMLLNYGFENLSIHVGGVPVIVSYGLMYTSLGLAVFSRRNLLIGAVREPVMLCLLALLLLSFLHLILDIPSYGIWAIRDASMFFDGTFLALGLLWAMSGKRTIPLMKWLMVVYLLNLVYSYSLPWGEKIRAWSPNSGAFHPAAILGNYDGNDIHLLLGALFCMFLGRYVVRWPHWILVGLAMAQLFGLAIVQARAMYIGLVVVLIVLFLLGETRKSAKFVLVLSSAFVALLLLTAVGGLEIPGRVGPINIAFLTENVRSIVGAETKAGTAGATVAGRFDWYDQVFARIRQNPLLGEGFGQPLIDFNEEFSGAAVRQPHNSSISILARLGAIGFAIWVVFNLCLIKRFIYAFRQRRYCDQQLSDLVLWLFMLYLTYMIDISVEPGLEFPSGAVPFYFFVGLALGLIRWQVPQKNERDHRMAAFVLSSEKAL